MGKRGVRRAGLNINPMKKTTILLLLLFISINGFAHNFLTLKCSSQFGYYDDTKALRHVSFEELLKIDSGYFFYNYYLDGDTLPVMLITKEDKQLVVETYNYGSPIKAPALEYIKAECTYDSCRLIFNGNYIELNSKGDTISNQNYVMDKLEGRQFSIETWGWKIGIDEFHKYFSCINGLKQGEAECFYENSLVLKAQFDSGYRSGIWQYYHKNGVIMAEGEYSKESYKDAIDVKSIFIPSTTHNHPVTRFKKKGIWKYYNEEGKLILEVDYNKLYPLDWVDTNILAFIMVNKYELLI